jgi:hypothetical protein
MSAGIPNFSVNLLGAPVQVPDMLKLRIAYGAFSMTSISTGS